MAKIELTVKANTEGAVKNLKATQANINRVADAFVSLQNEGVGLDKLNNSVAGFYDLVDRLAGSMFSSGEAASYFEAKTKVLAEALKSASLMNNGEFSGIADSLLNSASAADQAAGSVVTLKDVEEQLASNTKEATKEVTKQGASLIKTTNDIANKGSKLLDTAKNIFKFQLLLAPIRNLMSGIRNTFNDSIKFAAEAEQIYSKLNTVFGGFNSAMTEAIDLSQKLGVSTSTAASALSTVGDLLQAQGAGTVESLQMASEWVEQFQDIIAFKDIDMSLEEFAQNFMSGAAGNLRNFRTFGSIVKESAVNARLAAKGLDTLTGSELELAKMTARAEIALEQQSNAIGATEREWETLLSVNRRYSEAMKQLKEYIGTDFAETFKGLKSWWTEILEATNKSLQAQKQWLAGAKNISTYKMTDPDDRATFNRQVASDLAGYRSNDSWTVEGVYSNFTNLMGQFNATYEDFVTAVEASGYVKQLDKFSTSLEGVSFRDVLSMLKTAADAQAMDREREETVQAAREALVSVAERADAFIDAIGSIPGMSLTSDFASMASGTSFSRGTVEGVSEAVGKYVGDGVRAGIESALTQMAGMDLDKYRDLSKVVFGDDQTASSLETWLDNIEELYTILFNRRRQLGEESGVTEKDLSDLVALWKSAKGELEGYNNELERQKNVLSSVAGFNGTATDYGTRLSEAVFARGLTSGGMGADRASALAAQNTAFLSASALATTMEEIEAVETANNAALRAINEWFDDVEKLAEEEDERAKAEARKQTVDDTLAEYLASIQELQFENTLIGMEEFDASLEKAKRSFDLMLSTLDLTDEELAYANELYQQYIEALEDQKKRGDEEAFQQKVDDLFGEAKLFEPVFDLFAEGFRDLMEVKLWKDIDVGTILNGFGQLFSEIFEGIGGWLGPKMEGLADFLLPDKMVDGIKSLMGALSDVGGNLVSFVIDNIIEILNRLDVFNELSGIVLDNLIVVLNDFLEPVMPIVTLLGDILHRIFVTILTPLYPLLQGICEALVVFMGLINAVIGLVENSVKWLVGNIVKYVVDAMNGLIGNLNKIPGVKIGKITNSTTEWAGINVWDEFGSDMDYMVDLLEEVAGNTFDTARNTSKGNYGVYADLLSRNMLSWDDYTSLVKSNMYSSSTTSGSAIMTSSGYGRATYITMNGLTINTDIRDPEGLYQLFQDFENRPLGAHAI